MRVALPYPGKVRATAYRNQSLKTLAPNFEGEVLCMRWGTDVVRSFVPTKKKDRTCNSRQDLLTRFFSLSLI